MGYRIAAWILGVGVLWSIMGDFSIRLDAREVDQGTYWLLSHEMTEAEVVSRTGQPERRLDQFEPTQLSQRLVSYLYVWAGIPAMVNGPRRLHSQWIPIVSFALIVVENRKVHV